MVRELTVNSAYSPNACMYRLINSKKNTIINEGISFEVGENERGGIVVLSTDVNAVLKSENKIIDKIKKTISTFKNRLTFKSTVDKIAGEHNIIGWTIGKYLNGRYFAKNGQTFSENSFSVEVVGIEVDELISFAEDLCEAFEQESVLVKDYSGHRVMFVDAEKSI